MNLNNKKILQLCRNAKSDRLQLLHIELSEDLKVITDNTQKEMDKNPQQYIWLQGKASGITEALTTIEYHLRNLEYLESKSK